MSDAERRDGLSWPARAAVFLLPVLGSLLEHQEVRENPWYIALLLPGWAVMYALVRVVTSLWERIEPAVVDECHNRLLTWFRSSQKSWNELVVFRFRDFDVKGLATQGPFTLELMQVYVDLRIVASPLHAAPTNPLLEPAAGGEASSSETGMWPALLSSGRIAILGAPGCGKTTLLKHAALTLAGQPSTRRALGAPDATPILLYLREIAPHIAAEGFTIVEAVQRTAPRGTNIDLPWLRRRLSERACVIMLDGLDEVSDPQVREQLSRWVEDQVSSFPGNHWIVSSRPFGYQANPLTGFTVLAVQPLRRGQIETFLRQWYLANEIRASAKDDPGVRMKAADGAEDLLARLDKTPDLSKLAVNPLLLTLIASVHRFRSSLPGRRVELYSEICDVFLGRRQEARGVAIDLTPAQKKLVLQRLAWELMSTGRREIQVQEAADVIREPLERVRPGDAPVDFLRMVERGSGLLMEREAGTWSFSHKTFQEYLAAAHAQDRALGGELALKVADEWWHETIRLFVAQGDASPIIAACLEGDPPTLPALLLAIQCADEGREVAPDVRKKLLSLVDNELDSGDERRWRLAAECLLEMRLRNLRRVDEGVYVDDSPITNAEYQLFVDAEAAAGQVRALDHWPGMRFADGEARAPVLGVRGVDALAFCDWLTRRDGGDWWYRLPMTSELSIDGDAAGDDDALWAVDDEGDPVVLSGGRSPDRAMLPRLEQCLSKDLSRLLDLTPEERAEMGLDVSEEEVKALQRLLTWALRGDLRLIFRLIKSAVVQWPKTWWWRAGGRCVSAGLDIIKGLAKAAGWMLRPFVWLFGRVFPEGDEEVRQRRMMALARTAGRIGEALGRTVMILFKPVFWVIKPWISRAIQRRIHEERQRFLAERAGEPAEPQRDLKKLMEETVKSKEGAIQSIGDLAMLAMLTALGEFLMDGSIRFSVNGKSLVEASSDDSTPQQVAGFAQVLAFRGWHAPIGGEEGAIGDATWGMRVALLLAWRRTSAAVIAAMIQARKAGTEPTYELKAVPISLWLEAWIIEGRVSGAETPFETIHLVKERRHLE